ncbi:uncharacterized protein TM35_000212140 [Trypanosoma theileri]|uniref:Uncharacterized protein n=1 Tax=Trypanosoma theileri TaxID=67003 RepID=A0A1X0NSU3_9TRYP|nr:uncharacterized protein TM35_000212140 [Trypanosoma theileri]ORC87608.1 hypothetical protein TM35_000212140 [Trypanosoma theileri]
MLKGSNGDILRVVRATAAKKTFVPAGEERSAVRNVVNMSSQAPVSLPPLLTSSLLWASALSQRNESPVVTTSASASASTTNVDGLFYERINSEAKQLGFDAIERAEVRRRAKLFLLEKDKYSLSEASPSKTGNTRNKKQTLVDSLKEEIEGCQMWSAAAAAQIPTHFFIGIDIKRTSEKEMSTCNSDIVNNNNNDNNNNDGVHEECIQRLFEAIAVVSVMLYYLRPLRNAISTAVSAIILSSSLLSSSEYLLGELLSFFEELLRKGGAAPYIIAEVLVHDVSSRIPLESVVQPCFTFIHQRRDEIIRSVNRIQIALEDVKATTVLGVEVHGEKLHTLNEEQLRKIRVLLQRELRQHLKKNRDATTHSLQQSQYFLLACNQYKEMVGKNTQHIHPRRLYKERFLYSDLSCGYGVSSQRIQMEKKVEGNTIIESGKPKKVNESVITMNSSHHNIISSSRWERTVLEVWRAHREVVFTVLLRRPFSLKRIIKKKKKEEKCKGQYSHEWGKFMSSNQLTDTVEPEELWCHLSAIVEVHNHDSVVPLIDTLLDWVKNEKNIKNKQIYTIHAVELVIFLFAAKVHSNNDYGGKSDDVRLPLEKLLQRIEEKHLSTTINSNSDSNSNSNSIPLLNVAFQALTEPLSTFLVDATFTALFSKEKEINSSSSSSVWTHDSSFPPLRWVWGNNRLSLMCMAALLWNLHSSKALNHAILTLRDNKFFSHSINTDSTILSTSTSTSFSLLQWHAHVLVLLTTMIKYGNHGSALTATIVESSSSPLKLRFLLTVVEWLNTSLLAILNTIHVRTKKPLPRFISEALWDVQIPLTIWALHHITSMRNECGLVDVCKLVENCQLIINDLTLRWDYSIVPKRRYHKKETMPSIISTTMIGLKEEYEADAIIADRVVKFASLLEGELLSALDVLPHLFSNSRSFSCMCNAVGIVLYDVDIRTGHQIMKYLLHLLPNEKEMDVEAHVGIIRCLSSMRHGCTLWQEALYHFTRAVTLINNINKEDEVSLQRNQRFSHIPSDLSTARVLRCVGSSPLSYSMRCLLTFKVVAFARAAGVPLNTQSFSACLHNFTMRKEETLLVGSWFNNNNNKSNNKNNHWCDALQWYDDMNTSTLLSSRDLSFFLSTCLQSMLAQGEWSDALLSRPLVEWIRLYAGSMKLDPYDYITKVFILLTLCASDRTRSCANAAKALFQSIQDSSLHMKSSTVNYKVLEELYHTAISDISPSLYNELNTTISRTPLFRKEAPVIPKPVIKREETLSSLQLRRYGVLYTHTHYNHHEALVVKLRQSLSSRLDGTPKETTNTSSSSSSSEEEEGQQQQQQKRGKGSLVQIRERVSRVFPLMQVVWSEEILHSEKVEENDENSITGDAARSLMDTRYASVLIPLRKLEKLRAEKRNGIRRRHLVLKSEKGKGKVEK